MATATQRKTTAKGGGGSRAVVLVEGSVCGTLRGVTAIVNAP